MYEGTEVLAKIIIGLILGAAAGGSVLFVQKIMEVIQWTQ